MAAKAWSLASPAKLNWSLQVLGKRADGFHQLRSLFVAVNLYDTLRVRVASTETPSLQVQGLGAAHLPCDQRNLVLQAEAAWRAAGGEAPAVAWQLEKNIPAAAGLGGGSGNAAAALRLLDHVATQKARVPLAEIAAALGSDVPFFLADGPLWLGGRGEHKLGRVDPTPQRVLLVAPAMAVSTAEVFAAMSVPLYDANTVEPAPPATAWPAQAGPNDLLPGVLQASPSFARFWQQLQNIGPFQLSGSGGACFLALPKGQDSARLLPQCKDLCDHVWELSCLGGPVLGAVHEHPES